MKNISFLLYNLVLSLWVGGIFIFTFIVTPAIFKSFGRDMAGVIVGKLFPGYFLYNLILSVLALILFLFYADIQSRAGYKLIPMLIAAAIAVNVYIKFNLYPDIVRVKQEIVSFETTPAEHPLRKKFTTLHGVSAALNLILLADGVIIFVYPLLKK